jgi:dTMP kinase
MLRDRLRGDGHKSRLVSFPDYATSIGEELARALAGEREYGADVMQLLYVANRYERKDDLQRWIDGGLILVSDRYTASSTYGEVRPDGVADRHAEVPAGRATIFLDINPDRGAAEGRRPGSLRARSCDAEARA